MSSSRLNAGKLETSAASEGVASGEAEEDAVALIADAGGSSSVPPHAPVTSASAAIVSQTFRIQKGIRRRTREGLVQGIHCPPAVTSASIDPVGTGQRVARSELEEARRTLVDNVRGLTLEEALDAGGGYRSVLGLLKHTAGWSEVYHSFAFDAEPHHWDDADWPRGLRERIEPSPEYVGEVLAWFERGAERWLASVDDAADLDEPRPVHWGERHPLREIVAMVAGHWTYHAGEINAILAIRRGEAWEVGEAVEENHISTVGRSVRREWISDEDAKRQEERLRTLARERERNEP